MARSLSVLEADIQSKLQKLNQAIKVTIGIACGIGDDLIVAKKRMDHGEFGPWCKRLGISSSSASDYMKLASYQDRNAILDSPSIREAKKLIQQKNQIASAGNLDTEYEETRSNVRGSLDNETNKPLNGELLLANADAQIPMDCESSKNEPANKPQLAGFSCADQYLEFLSELEEPKRSIELRKVCQGIAKACSDEERRLLSHVLTFGLDDIQQGEETPSDDESEIDEDCDSFKPKKIGKFQPPSRIEIAEYIKERSNKALKQNEHWPKKQQGPLEMARAFFAHHEARGWKLKTGKTMVKWKAAVVTWGSMTFGNQQTEAEDPYKDMRRIGGGK